jgi:hypothetical protein
MINWTQPGAGLRNAGMTDADVNRYYGNALTNYNYAQQNRNAAPNPLGPAQTMRSNPFDTNSAMVGRTGLGYDTQRTQASARQQNAQAAGLPITQLAGWMEKQGLGQSNQIANNVSKNGLGQYQQYLSPARDWELRETVRGNVQSGGGIVGMGLKGAPYIMSYAAGGFGNPLVGGLGGAKAGGTNFLKSAASKAIKSYGSPAGLAQKAQGAIMGQTRR